MKRFFYYITLLFVIESCCQQSPSSGIGVAGFTLDESFNECFAKAKENNQESIPQGKDIMEGSIYMLERLPAFNKGEEAATFVYYIPSIISNNDKVTIRLNVEAVCSEDNIYRIYVNTQPSALLPLYKEKYGKPTKERQYEESHTFSDGNIRDDKIHYYFWRLPKATISYKQRVSSWREETTTARNSSADEIEYTSIRGLKRASKKIDRDYKRVITNIIDTLKI